MGAMCRCTKALALVLALVGLSGCKTILANQSSGEVGCAPEQIYVYAYKVHLGANGLPLAASAPPRRALGRARAQGAPGRPRPPLGVARAGGRRPGRGGAALEGLERIGHGARRIVAGEGRWVEERREYPHRDSNPDWTHFKCAASTDWAMGAGRDEDLSRRSGDGQMARRARRGARPGATSSCGAAGGGGGEGGDRRSS